MNGLSSSELEFLAAVKSDLLFLEEEWDHEITEQSLRRSSTVLRNLVVQDALGRAWRLAGHSRQPDIRAIDLAGQLAGLRYEKVEFASAGAGKSGGGAVAGVLIYADALSERQVKERYERGGGEPQTRLFSLSQFASSPGVGSAGRVNRAA